MCCCCVVIICQEEPESSSKQCSVWNRMTWKNLEPTTTSVYVYFHVLLYGPLEKRPWVPSAFQTMCRFLLWQTEIWSHIDKEFLWQGYRHSLGKVTYRQNINKRLCKGKKWHAKRVFKWHSKVVVFRENLSCCHHCFHKNHCFVEVVWIGNVLETLESSYVLQEWDVRQLRGNEKWNWKNDTGNKDIEYYKRQFF